MPPGRAAGHEPGAGPIRVDGFAFILHIISHPGAAKQECPAALKKSGGGPPRSGGPFKDRKEAST
jgi:hypothetical protein